MKNFIWHNPRCSKSRQTLALIQDAGIELDVVNYLETPPDGAQIAAACAGLACKPTDIIRSKEALFGELGLSLDDTRSENQWCDVLSQHPRLLERPIVRIHGRYALGRPPENVSALLG